VENHLNTPVEDAMSPQDGPTTAKRHILLVDDDKIFGAAVGKTLRNAGFQVTIAANFRVALEVLEDVPPLDLLLADIVMPAGVNGLALSRMARLRRPNLKVVYMTGYSISGIEREALGPILLKPIDDDRLISEVERALATA
jgi:DNA-binding NtrC family response regulator